LRPHFVFLPEKQLNRFLTAVPVGMDLAGVGHPPIKKAAGERLKFGAWRHHVGSNDAANDRNKMLKADQAFDVLRLGCGFPSLQRWASSMG
jgi:hypothetical protein